MAQQKAMSSETLRSSTTTTTRTRSATHRRNRSETEHGTVALSDGPTLTGVLCVWQGSMSITVCHGGDPIPKSPFNIGVAPPLDLSRVKVQGLSNSE